MGLLGTERSHPEAKEEQHMRGEIKTMSHVTAGRFIEMSELNYRN